MLLFEQRENVKFCQKLDKSSSETFQMMKQAYGEEALGRSAVFKWHKRFIQGETIWKMTSIRSAKNGTFLKLSFSSVSSRYTNISRIELWPTATNLREGVDMCNMVRQNNSPRIYWLYLK
jgi:hypothetical protein